MKQHLKTFINDRDKSLFFFNLHEVFPHCMSTSVLLICGK